MRGVDISRYDDGLKIEQIKKAGYDFAILRGGYTGYGDERSKHKDSCFETFYAEAKEMGFPVGVYWYSCATDYQFGVDEAEYLYKHCLKGKSFEMPIYMDVEEPRWQQGDKNGVTDAIIGFCKTLEAKGFYVGVYASLYWFNTYIDTARLDSFAKWVAAWTDSKPDFKFSEFGLWQYTSSGNVAGYRMDLNECYLDYPSIIKKAGLNGYGETDINENVDDVAYDVFFGKWGVGDDRRQRLTDAGYDYDAVQQRVNEIFLIVRGVINGDYGNGAERKEAVEDAGFEYEKIRAVVNYVLTDEIARQVIAGYWGDGAERRKRLTEAGYDYDTVQARVNELENV